MDELLTELGQRCTTAWGRPIEPSNSDYPGARLVPGVFNGECGDSGRFNGGRGSSTSSGSCQELAKMIKGKASAGFLGMASVMNSYRSGYNSIASWIIDSGASDHMVCSASLLSNIRKLHSAVSICLPDGSLKSVSEIGDVEFASGLVLIGVFLVPEFKQNLLSIGKLLDDSLVEIKFDKGLCTFQDLRNGKVLLAARREKGGLYKADFLPFNSSSPYFSTSFTAGHKIDFVESSCKNKLNFDIVHARLGHVSLSKLKHICEFADLRNDEDYCDICLLSKFHALPFTRSNSTVNAVFELIHMDLWGPYKAATYSGAHYFLTILDDFSRTSWTHLIHSKDQVGEVIKDFVALV